VEAPAGSKRAASGNEPRADDDLVSMAQAGNTQAFDLLVRKYQQKVVNIAMRLVGEADAMDVAQETFIKAYRSLRGFRGQSAFYTWLYRIAINTSKNHLVARNRRPSYLDIEVEEAELYGHADRLSDIGTPESNVLAQEIKEVVSHVIRRLPPELQQAILLRELNGFSYEDIAQVLKCPIGTVRSRIFRAREAVDAVVKPLMA
jgi:RNA polymerase sigma-70 factor (ECF subfamily)